MKILILLLFINLAWAEEYTEQQINAVKEKFELEKNFERDRQLACVANGTNPKTCMDPHWCLYPNKLDTIECTWYRVKYKING